MKLNFRGRKGKKYVKIKLKNETNINVKTTIKQKTTVKNPVAKKKASKKNK